MKHLAIAVTPFLAVAVPSGAGEAWLIADSGVVNDGDLLWLSCVDGEVFPYGDAAADPDRIASFVDLYGDQGEDINRYAAQGWGISIHEPIVGCGTHVLRCSLKPELRAVSAEAFRAYLVSQGAERALTVWDRSRDLRALPGVAHDPDDAADDRIIERATQFAKTVVEVQPVDSDDRGHAAVLGDLLEIIPMSHPCHWTAGTTVRVKVLLDGHPWPDVPVWAGHEGLEARTRVWQGRTDGQGVASVQLTRSGHWFIAARLIRPTNGLDRAQWESFHASLTFRARGKTDVSGMLRAIRAAGGEVDPWAIAGYRMGRRALEELAQPRGGAVLAVHETPSPQLSVSIADGILAATGVSSADAASGPHQGAVATVQTEFMDRSVGRAVVLRLRAAFIRMISDVPREERLAAALRASTLSDDEMFEIVPTSRPLLSPGWFEQPIGLARSSP